MNEELLEKMADEACEIIINNDHSARLCYGEDIDNENVTLYGVNVDVLDNVEVTVYFNEELKSALDLVRAVHELCFQDEDWSYE